MTNVYFKKGENHGFLPVDEADINSSFAFGERTGRNREPRALPVGIYNQNSNVKV